MTMANFRGEKRNKRKDPKRVKAGKKAWITRLKHQRDEEIIRAGASMIPGVGLLDNASKIVDTESKIRKEKRKRKGRN